MDDLISRQAAIDALKKPHDVNLGVLPTGNRSYEDIWKCVAMAYDMGAEYAVDCIVDLPSAQPDLTPDGTLNISVGVDVAKVGRILLTQTGTQEGGLYYKDAQPEPEELDFVQPHKTTGVKLEVPLADKEIVSRLRTIQMQVGGSYAIDRAIEIIEAVAERRTDD